MPEENDSPFLLDPHRRGLQNLDRMARYREQDAGRPRRRRRGRGRRHARAAARPRGLADRDPREGPVLGPRPRLGLRREGLGQALLDGHARDRRHRPDRDGQEQLGRRRRRLDDALRGLRAALPPVRLRDERRATASAPTGRSPTGTCSDRSSGVERELPVAGQDWPWGDPHTYPHAPHPIAGAAVGRLAGRAPLRDRDARRPGLDHERRLRQPAALHLPRLLPPGLQGEREGEPADHAPPGRDRARRRGARRRDGDRGSRSTTRPAAAPASPTSATAREHFQRAEAVAVCGYAIETPRLLLNSPRSGSRTGSRTAPTRSAAT